jgi:hypothetical protein
VGHGYDDVALLYPNRHEREAERIGAAIHRHRALGVAERGKLLFEVLDHGAADETGGTNDLLKDCREFFLELHVRSNQIKKWNILRMIHSETPVSI